MPEQQTKTRGRVLVIDDVSANCELLRQELEEEGFDVTVAHSGQDGLRTAAAYVPDVVLLDIQMPGMNGIEVCKVLKSTSGLESIPVLFLTASQDVDEALVVEALRAGGNDFLSKPYSPAILVARVACQVAIARAHAELRELAMLDSLTGVYSRRHLFESLFRLIKSAHRAGGRSISCLMVDIDHFKNINDVHGHLEGDKILRSVAQTISRSTRTTDIVARYGGEEFVVLLPETSIEGGMITAETIRRSVETECAPVTVSIGVSSKSFSLFAVTKREATHEGVTASQQDLLRRADAALYDAKRAGRNRVHRESRDGQ